MANDINRPDFNKDINKDANLNKGEGIAQKDRMSQGANEFDANKKMDREHLSDIDRDSDLKKDLNRGQTTDINRNVNNDKSKAV